MKKYNIQHNLKQLLIEALKDLEKKLGRKAYYNDLKDPKTGGFSLTPDEYEKVIARSGGQMNPTRPLRGPYAEPNQGNNNKTVPMRPQDDTQPDAPALDTQVDDFSSTFVAKATDALTAALQSRMDDFHGDEEKVKKAVEDELRKVVRGMI